MAQGRLIIDIETVGERFDDMDELTQSELTKHIEAAPDSPEYAAAIARVDDELVFSPLTGFIVAIGVMDADKEQSVVYYQDPSGSHKETVEGSVTYKPMDEAQMLESFWGGAKNYTEFITWNGRSFDIPYLIVRSAIHQVHISKDLMSNRYVGSQTFDAKHIDLFDQVSFYGAVRRPGGLHMWTRALGIETPKSGEVAASDVGKAFAEQKYLDIAQYNAKDLVATKELYDVWRTYFRP